MRRMTFKELCKYMRIHENDSDKCEHYKNEFLTENHGAFRYEEIEESDIANLRPYIQCVLLSFYECIAEMCGRQLPEWFRKYDGVYCPKEESDYYLALIKSNELLNANEDYSDSLEVANDVYDMAIESAVEPFKKRGICKDCLDDTV